MTEEQVDKVLTCRQEVLPQAPGRRCIVSLFIFVKRFSRGGRGKQIRERAQRSVRDENVGEGRGG